jgi:putative transposase
MIQSIITKYKLKNKISYLCKVAKVSRTGYHNHFSSASQVLGEKRDERDQYLKEMILKDFHYRGRKKGARQT